MALIKITPEAEEDLYRVWYYIAIEGQNPRNADKFIRSIHIFFEKLALSPMIGAVRDEYVPGVHQFVFGTYLIFYFPIHDGIEVVRIIHGARNLQELF